MSRHNYRQPGDEHAFEDFCLILFQDAWSRSQMEKYGRRGERQYGVDLVDMSGEARLVAVQCKHHDATKTLPPKELEDEVEKAKKFPSKLAEYYVLTTAKKSTKAQDRIRELNQRHRKSGLFQIRLLTWDDIQDVIDKSPLARQFLGLEPDDATTRAVREVIAPLRTVVTDHAVLFHGELDEAKGHLERGEPQDALVLLRRIRRRSWTDLTPGQKSRLATLEAEVALRRNERLDAARLLLEARSHADDEKALANEIVARRLLDDTAKAFQLSEALVARFPDSALAWSLFLGAAPSEGLAKAVAGIPSALRETIPVLASLAERAELGAASQAAARKGIEIAPEEARFWFALGSILLEGESVGGRPDSVGRAYGPSAEKLTEAAAAFDAAGQLAQTSGHQGAYLEALLRRATVARLQNQQAAARITLQEAVRIAPADARVLLAAGQAAEQRREFGEAVALLRRASACGARQVLEDAQFLLGVALWNRAAEGDRDEAARLLVLSARGKGSNKGLALSLAVEGLIVRGALGDGVALVAELCSSNEPSLIAMLEARIAAAAGAPDADERATAALSSLGPNSTLETRGRLAALLMRAGRHRDALPILEEVSVPELPGDLGERLLECALRTGRHDVALRYCQRARARRGFDESLMRVELSVLEQYDPLQALQLMQELLAATPSPSIRLRLAVLALRLGRQQLARDQVPHFPPVTSVDASEGEAVVRVLIQLSQSHEARTYAYDLLRRYFGDHRAHRAFRDSTLQFGQSTEEKIPERVAVATAACLKEGAGPPHWYVIEDSAVEGSGVEFELGAKSALAMRLLGKRVGDEVVLSEGAGLRRAASVVSIVSIVSKYAFRTRDVWDRWQYRFPDKNEMWVVPIPETTPGQPDLSRLYQVAEARRARVEQIEEFYRTTPMPLSVFANLGGETIFAALAHVASSDDLQVRCCVGSEAEFSSARAALRTASEVVLELSGLATILMLDLTEALTAPGKPLVISPTSLLELRSLASAASNGRFSESGMLVSTKSGTGMVVPAEEQKNARAAFLRRALDFVEKNASVVGVSELAGMDPEERTELSETIGVAALESAFLAGRENRVLWADDAILGVIAAEKFGSRRVWTQACLEVLVLR